MKGGAAGNHQGLSQQNIQTILAGLRRHFDMEVAFVSEFTHGQRVFRFVDSDKPASPVRVDGSDALDDTSCRSTGSGVLLAAGVEDCGQRKPSMTEPNELAFAHGTAQYRTPR